MTMWMVVIFWQGWGIFQVGTEQRIKFILYKMLVGGNKLCFTFEKIKFQKNKKF